MINDISGYIDLLTTSEVDQVIEHFDGLPRSDKYSSVNASRKLVHYDSNEFVKNMFEAKLLNHFPGGLIQASSFTTWHKNVELHTDGWQPHEDQNNKLGYAVLVPLTITPSDVDTHTIIFHQHYEGDNVTLMKWDNEKDWNIHGYLQNSDPRIQDKSELGIEDSYYYKYLTHIEKSDLDNFSVNGTYKWTPGKAIYWKRKHFHTSSNFVNELKEKMHLLFFIDFKN